MLIFATSDKGGTGRSVTSANMLYRRALQGGDVCYLDFDFGSPTAGTIFQVTAANRGTDKGGLHEYLHGRIADPYRIDVWSESDRPSLRGKPPGAGRLLLLPGDAGGGEFGVTGFTVERCAALLLRLDEEFDVCLVDLSAGRSYAAELVLAATARPELRAVPYRWLVFHRWTHQHIIAAAGLVHGGRGIIDSGIAAGHPAQLLGNAIRFVRTAVVEPDAPELAALRAAQIAWLRECNDELRQLSARHRIGRTVQLGTVPLDPLLQWREQLITDTDVWGRQIANPQTVAAFEHLATAITDDAAWESL